MSDRFDSQEFHELMMDYRASLLDPAAAYERVLEFIRSTPKQGEALKALRSIIASDSYAISFQTFGQYRTQLLKDIDALATPSVEPPPQVEPAGWVNNANPPCKVDGYPACVGCLMVGECMGEAPKEPNT